MEKENNAMQQLLKELTLVSNDNLLLRSRIRQLQDENRTLKKHIHHAAKLWSDEHDTETPPPSKL